ncbi:MAG TPA: HAD family hydrolase [Actinomycetota bacterium]|nr:HAD family hydrolase [Actinomycetota bacterium]
MSTASALPLHPRRVILWDVDGTLLSAGPIGRGAFFTGASDALGRDVPDDDTVQMAGKTDPLIALEILATVGITGDEARRRLPEVLEGLTRRLAEGRDRIPAEGKLHAGVAEVLERLDADPEVVQTVVSGNLAVNARIKVAAFGLERFLDLEVGAYGSDDEDRDRLVPIALERVRERYGHAPAPGETWVVGDTARDLACARAAGARCLLVATGRIAFHDLEPLGADGVRTDLSDGGAVADLLVG